MFGQFSSLFAVSPARKLSTRWEKRALFILLVLAAVVRFWGLGSYGLHKPDEDTTALPAVHILQDGTPRFPSGMLYTRAIVQSYLIAASVKTFGQTEWALRLPSVLCGLLLIALASIVGRRFLTPAWNIAFITAVSFLPGLIADSQEVRMYIFLVASLAAYAVFIFQWERSNGTAYLAAAVVAMVAGIQFQQLAIFGSLLIFFPGLVRGDRTKLWKAAFAFVPIAAYFVYVRWTPGPYPIAAADYAQPLPQLGEAPTAFGLRFQLTLTAAAVLFGVFIAWLFVRGLPQRSFAIPAATLLILGFVCLAGLYYHIALLLLLAGVILARRNGGVAWPGLAMLVVAVVAMAAVHGLMLQSAGAGSFRKIVGVMSGRPSIWPLLLVAAYTPIAASIAVVGLVVVVGRLAKRQTVADYWLFFLLCVWAPLFALGATGWYFPPRYTEFALLPLVLTALAATQQLMTVRAGASSSTRTRLGVCVAATICAIAIVNPFAFARAVNPGASFPDHRGAAEYMRSIKLGPKDIIVAEEVLLQTYYLGHVDYWLINRNVAATFVERWNGRFVDQYTHTPLIGSGEELRALLNNPNRGALYVIGSGEDGRRFMRGEDIFAMLQSDEFKVVYVAQDKLTKVWRVDPPASK